MRLEELEPVTMFAVPPFDPRVRLYLDRSMGRPIQLQGYDGREGAQYASPVAYFGSLLFFGSGDEEVFDAVVGVLGGGDVGDGDGGDDDKAGDGLVLRADFAYDAALEGYLMLRAGWCGRRPEPYDSFPESAVIALEGTIAAHMNRPAIEAKLDRSERYVGDGALFEGEHHFLEGLVGFGSMPVPLKCEVEDISCLGLCAVGLSKLHDAGVLRELVRDYCAWAYGEGSPLARVHELWLFGRDETEPSAVAIDPVEAQ